MHPPSKKIGRNDPCPCGSNKKYKKCCGLFPGRQQKDRSPTIVTSPAQSLIKSSISGSGIVEEIPEQTLREILKPFPQAITLLDEVKDFFGELVLFDPQPPSKGNGFYRWLIKEVNFFPVFKGVRINLRLGASNTSSMLAHELFHLRQAIRGYPVRAGLISNQYWVTRDETITSIIDNTQNVVDHDLFLADYLACGLPRKDFSGRDQLDPVLLETSIISALKVIETMGGSVKELMAKLATNNLIEWLACKHLQLDDHSAMELDIYEKLIPGAARLSLWTREWFNRGDFRDPQKYAESLIDLFSTIHAPIPKYFRLNRTSTGMKMIRVGAN